MREILFRGKRVDNGEWVYGGFCYGGNRNESIICPKHDFSTEVIPETVGQYIGANDCTGTKIFEGDIVEYKEDTGCITYINEEAMFVVEFDTYFTDFDHLYSTQLEIIGNIHDNPELLKGETK